MNAPIVSEAARDTLVDLVDEGQLLCAGLKSSHVVLRCALESDTKPSENILADFLSLGEYAIKRVGAILEEVHTAAHSEGAA